MVDPLRTRPQPPPLSSSHVYIMGFEIHQNAASEKLGRLGLLLLSCLQTEKYADQPNLLITDQNYLLGFLSINALKLWISQWGRWNKIPEGWGVMQKVMWQKVTWLKARRGSRDRGSTITWTDCSSAAALTFNHSRISSNLLVNYRFI